MRRGFTLLEVMISLGILAVGLVAISDLNGGAVQMHAYSRKATEATLLLRGKMLDVEEDLQKNGFSDFNDEKHGTFDDEEDGAGAGYAWTAEILKPDVQMDASQLLSLLGVGGTPQNTAAGSSSTNSLTQGLTAAAAGITGGAPQGGIGAMTAPGSPLGGVMQAQATTFLETLKKSVREVRVTVTWKDGSQERSISASQHLVILPDMVGKAGQTPARPQVSAATGTIVQGQGVQ
jgi:general secretion pathway protein I